MLEKLIFHIKQKELTLSSFCFSFISIVIIRTLLEFTLEKNNLITYNLDFYSQIVDYLHIFISWLTLFFIVSLLIYFFTKDSFLNTLKLTLFMFPIVIIVPIFDYYFFESGEIFYNHSFDSFIFSYFNLFNPNANIHFITNGVKIEIALILLSAFIYTFISSKKLINSFLVIFFIYNFIYLYGYFPALFYTFLNSSNEAILQNSVLVNKSQMLFYFYMYLPVFIFLLSFLSLLSKDIYKIILDSLRLERLSIYLGLMFFALLIASKKALILDELLNIFDILKIICAFLAIIFAFVYSVILNNIYDYELDKISNKQRVLVQKQITLNNYIQIKNFTFIFSLIFALCVNITFFFLVLFILALSFIYSASFFRVKQYFLLNNLTLSFVAISTFLSGYSLVDANYSFIEVDKTLLYFIFFFFFFATNLKDIKDEKADKKHNIQTLATIFGKKKAFLFTKIVLFFLISYFLYKLQISTIFTLFILFLFVLFSFIKSSERFLISIQFLVLILYIYYFLFL